MLKERALTYAQKMGWYVHPVNKDKTPKLRDWPNQASIDPDQIENWWNKWPDANIGIVCGPRSGIFVVDLDLPDGPETMRFLEEKNGALPDTIIQKTGSGGKQLFFSCNGQYIENSSRKIGPGIDIKGHNGYVILPESSHPSGGTYQWLKKKKQPAKAPQWLIELIEAQPAQSSPGRDGYGEKALADELYRISSAGEGTRNDTLNRSAHSLGQLVAGGELDHGHVFNSLLGVATGQGLAEREARATIQSGLKSGAKTPRTAPEQQKDIEYDLSDYNECQQSQQSQQSQRGQHQSTSSQHPVNISQHKSTTPHNLQAAIFNFIKNSKGSFTTIQVDQEFGLKTRQEKQARGSALYRAKESGLIKKDKQAAGKYHIIDDDVQFVDLDTAEEQTFPIYLPFNLHDYVYIPCGSIIILAGTSNAGKSALILETLRLNLGMPWEKFYFFSEMSAGEYKQRLQQFDMPMHRWKEIKAAPKAYDFDNAIRQYNQDGLTCIDYLEEVDGEYFKIASHIRDIYDSLDQGIALISIQKRKRSEVGIGGEATTEKARLYLVLDFLCVKEHSIVCALQVYKNKMPKGRKNIIQHELHFEIYDGSQFNVLMPWTPSSKINRQQCVSKYEMAEANEEFRTEDEDAIIFKTDAGRHVRIISSDIEKWQERFQNMNVREELEKIAGDSMEKPFLQDKNWFMHLEGIMTKKSKNVPF